VLCPLCAMEASHATGASIPSPQVPSGLAVAQLAVEVLQQKARVQAELLRIKDRRIETLRARLGSALSCPSCGKATGQLSTPVADDDMQESFSSSPPGEVGMAELLARCERLEKLVAETAEAVENNSLFLRQRASGNLRGSRVVR